MTKGKRPTDNNSDQRQRLAHEQPHAIKQGWRYHHLGIPTTISRPGERYLKQHGMWVCGYETSPYGIEWMRFDEDSPIDDLIKAVPHVCFEVDDLDKEAEGKEIIGGKLPDPELPIRAIMIVDDGAPVELIEFKKPQ